MPDVGKCNRETILRILDRARWAPSGDNTQPWRFEIVADDRGIVHGHDTRDEILYDFDGHASHMAHGALLETMRMAASAESLVMTWHAEADKEWRKIQYHFLFEANPSVVADPLHCLIESRAVQRRPMSITPLTDSQRQALLSAPGSDFDVQLFETLSDRKKIAGLLWDNAYIRLTCPEAFPVHQSIIEWGARYSVDRIPEQAVGVDPFAGRLMRWVMKSWGRVDLFNRYLLGTIPPRIQLDYLPALMCAAHVLIKPKYPLASLNDWVALGGAMQRLWLTCSGCGLYLQPEMTPVIFRWYVLADRRFSASDELSRRAHRLAKDFERISGAAPADEFGFFCRVGGGNGPQSRSLRLNLDRLLV